MHQNVSPSLDHGGGEPFQIANYGIGGVYNHHPDPHGWHRPGREVREGEGAMVHLEGDRVATVMAYISPVTLGGATAFPNAGVAVQVSTCLALSCQLFLQHISVVSSTMSLQPEEGASVFWWNLHSNGLTDQLTLHGGCPVLIGSKWITNK